MKIVCAPELQRGEVSAFSMGTVLYLVIVQNTSKKHKASCTDLRDGKGHSGPSLLAFFFIHIPVF